MLRNHLALEITEGRVPIVEVNRIENRVSSCRISQRFDSVAEVSECTDHSECAYSLGLLAYRRAAFLIANAFMQKRIQISWHRRCAMARWFYCARGAAPNDDRGS